MGFEKFSRNSLFIRFFLLKVFQVFNKQTHILYSILYCNSRFSMGGYRKVFQKFPFFIRNFFHQKFSRSSISKHIYCILYCIVIPGYYLKDYKFGIKTWKTNREICINFWLVRCQILTTLQVGKIWKNVPYSLIKTWKTIIHVRKLE